MFSLHKAFLAFEQLGKNYPAAVKSLSSFSLFTGISLLLLFFILKNSDNENKTQKKTVFIFLALILIHLSLNTWFAHKGTLEKKAVSGDEWSLVYQSDLFSNSKLFNTSIPNSMGLLKQHHVVATPEKEFSKYPPGTPLIFSFFRKTGFDGMANMILTLLSALLMFFYVRRLSGNVRTALLSLVIFSFSSTVVFHGASWFSHTPVMFFLLLMLFLLPEKQSEISTFRLLLTGTCLGAVIFIRQFDAFLILVAFSGYIFINDYKNPRVALKKLFITGSGVTPFFLLFLIYQKIYTSSWFKSPYAMYRFSTDLSTGKNIGEINTGIVHFFSRGLGGLTPLWLRTQADWSNPFLSAVFILFPLLLFFHEKGKKLSIFLLLPSAFILGYAFHNAPGGDSYGARYYFPVFFAFCAGIAVTITSISLYLKKVFGNIAIMFAAITSILYFQGDMEIKNYVINKRVKKRFSIFKYVSNKLPPEKKHIVLIKNPPVMDSAFFSRRKHDMSDDVIYGSYPKNSPEKISQLRADFPLRNLYLFDKSIHSGKITLKKITEPEDR